MFNVFYYVTYTSGFYSFNSRTANVLPCSMDPRKSFHDWKNKFFYIRRGVIPIGMHYCTEDDDRRLVRQLGLLKEKAMVAAGIMSLMWVTKDPRVVLKMMIGGWYANWDWYKTLTRTPTAILQLKEKAMVAAGYNLMNVLVPAVNGEMTTRLLLEGEKPWVERIKDNFLHPSSESLNTYIATPLGYSPLCEESTGSSHGLTHRSAGAGSRARPVQVPGGDAASTPPTAEPKVATVGSKQKEPERKELPDTQIRKHSFRPKFLDYVVVSDSLSGLDVGMKRPDAGDEDDQATLTQMMEKKRKLLADEKRELDAQAEPHQDFIVFE
ncbi:hypothetical protein Hanom_Chr02g00103911 [Helianthus anomalus]